MTNLQAPVSDRSHTPGRAPHGPRSRLLSAPVLALPVAFVAVLLVGAALSAGEPAPAPAPAPVQVTPPAPQGPAGARQDGPAAAGGQVPGGQVSGGPAGDAVTTVRIDVPDGSPDAGPGESVGAVRLATADDGGSPVVAVDRVTGGAAPVRGLAGRRLCVSSAARARIVVTGDDPAVWNAPETIDRYVCSRPVPSGTREMTVRIRVGPS